MKFSKKCLKVNFFGKKVQAGHQPTLPFWFLFFFTERAGEAFNTLPMQNRVHITVSNLFI